MFDSKPLSHGEKGAKRHLRHKGKPRRRKGNDEKRGKIPITNNIADRPKEANERTRIGDWEADTVLVLNAKVEPKAKTVIMLINIFLSILSSLNKSKVIIVFFSVSVF